MFLKDKKYKKMAKKIFRRRNMKEILSKMSRRLILKKVFLFFVIFSLMFSILVLGADLKLRVIAKKANVRLTPSLNSDTLSQVPLGAILDSEGKTGEWYKVNLPADESGFVVSGYLHESTVEVIKESKKSQKIEKIKPQKFTKQSARKPAQFASYKKSAIRKGSFIISGTASIEIYGGELYGDSATGIALYPAFRYFIKHKIFVGGVIGYSRLSVDGDSLNLLQIGPCVGYVFGPEKSKMYPYVELELLYTSMSIDGYSISGFDLVLGGGVIYPIRKHLALIAEGGFHVQFMEEASGNIFKINIGIAGLIF
jgi:hypothetical protein